MKHLKAKHYSIRTGIVAKRQLLLWGAALVLSVSAMSLCIYKLRFASLPPITSSVANLTLTAKPMTINWPVNGQAAIGDKLHGVLAKGEDQQVAPTASIAKLMTALTVLKKYPLELGQQGPIITLDSHDEALYHNYLALNGSTTPVVAGEQISQYQALQALLLPSANNIADSLALWAYGDMGSYHKAANQLAAQLHMSKSRFADDASGLSPATVSTPHDLILLGQAVLDNPVLAQIVKQPSASMPVAGTIHSTNKLLGINNFIGIKTGNSEQAGYCLLFAQQQVISGQQITLIGVIMGQPDKHTLFKQARLLAESAFTNYEVRLVAKADQNIITYNVPWQGQINAVTKSDIESVYWVTKPANVRVVSAPINTNTANTTSAGQLVVDNQFGKKDYDLILDQPLLQPSVWWKLTH